MQCLGKGTLCLSSSLFGPLQRRYTVHITNHDMNPGYVGAMHCCKAPLWVRRPDLNSQVANHRPRGVVLGRGGVLWSMGTFAWFGEALLKEAAL